MTRSLSSVTSTKKVPLPANSSSSAGGRVAGGIDNQLASSRNSFNNKINSTKKVSAPASSNGSTNGHHRSAMSNGGKKGGHSSGSDGSLEEISPWLMPSASPASGKKDKKIPQLKTVITTEL